MHHLVAIHSIYVSLIQCVEYNIHPACVCVSPVLIIYAMCLELKRTLKNIRLGDLILIYMYTMPGVRGDRRAYHSSIYLTIALSLFYLVFFSGGIMVFDFRRRRLLNSLHKHLFAGVLVQSLKFVSVV